MLYYEKHKSIIRTFLASDEEVSAFLFSEYKRRILEEDVTVSEFLLPAPNNKFVIDEFEKAGFSPELMESDTICTELSELKTLPFMKAKSQNDVRMLKMMPKNGFYKEVRNMAMFGDHEMDPDLLYLPRTWFDSDVSCACYVNDEIAGMLLVHKRVSGSLEMVLMSAHGKGYQQIIADMIKQVVQSACSKYSMSTKFYITRCTIPAYALAEKLFPKILGMAVYSGIRPEMGE